MSRNIIIIPALIFCFAATAEDNRELFYSRRYIAEEDSNKLFFSVNNTNFFKNNEYFNDFYEGYTAIGYFFEPTTGIQLSTETRIEGGIHLLKFSGRDNFSSVLPVFRVHQKASAWMEVVLGTLYGSLNHRLIEPLYEFDHSFYRASENGLQFLIHTARLNSDIWLNWQQFIFWNDPFQEEFIQGTSTQIQLTKNSRFNILVPLQTVISHHGGQINHIDLGVQTLANLSPGIELSCLIKSKPVYKAGAVCHYIYYKDLSPHSITRYTEGYGIFPVLFATLGWFSAEAGYWKGYRFISPQGSYLFQSVSNISMLNDQPRRELITSRLTCAKEYKNGIKMGVRTETYYDFEKASIDYNYGIYIVFNRDFAIGKRQIINPLKMN